MTIACLHIFRSPDSAVIYTPLGTFDYEGNCRVIDGSCRAMSNENMTSLFPIRKTTRKTTLKAKKRGGISGLFPEWGKSRVEK
jgi:hypothetical protein